MKSVVFSLLVFAVFLSGGIQGQNKINWHGTAQFAGSIGYLSVGVGVSNRKQTLFHEILYGYVPNQFGGPRSKLSYKFSWMPYEIRLSESLRWRPLNPGAFLSYGIDKDLTLVPSYKKYHKDYYWWSSALRKHISFQTALVSFRPENQPCTQFYLEANTNDLYLVSYWENRKEMKFTDIWFLGMGFRHFF